MLWGYNKENGPSTWCKTYPEAAGRRQSPVDIVTKKTLPDRSLPKLCWKYVPENVETIINTGCGWKVTVDGHDSELSGGPLKDKYSIEQFHCHWGCADNQGSEHTINGMSYAAELHIVHSNLSKYGTTDKALKYPDGLCVLAVFLTPGREHPEFNKIIAKLPNIRFKNMCIDVGCSIDINSFIPTSSSYWTYEGSLTTPPCLECVTWIVFHKPIEVSLDQLNIFRTSTSCCAEESCNCSGDTCCINNNCRPTVPLGKRIVKKCT